MFKLKSRLLLFCSIILFFMASFVILNNYSFAAVAPPDPNLSNFISQCNSNTYGFDCVALYENYKFLANTAPDLFVTTLGGLPEGLDSISGSLIQVSLATLIIVFIVILFNSLFGKNDIMIANYNFKKLLPRIVISSVMIFASYFIINVAVDISNVVGNGLIGLFNSNDSAITENSCIADPAATTNNGLEKVAQITVPNLLCNIGFAGEIISANTTPNGLSYSVADVESSFAGLRYLNYFSMFAVIVAAGVISLRFGLIIALTFLAPLAFVAWILPNTKQLFDKWLKGILISFVMYPIILLFFQISYQIIVNLPDTNPVSVILKTFFSLVPFILMPISLWIGNIVSNYLNSSFSRFRSGTLKNRSESSEKTTKEADIEKNIDYARIKSSNLNQTVKQFSQHTEQTSKKLGSVKADEILEKAKKNAVNSRQSSSTQTKLQTDSVNINSTGDIRLTSSTGKSNNLGSIVRRNVTPPQNNDLTRLNGILSEQVSAIRDGKSLRSMPSFGRIKTQSLGAENVYAKNFAAERMSEFRPTQLSGIGQTSNVFNKRTKKSFTDISNSVTNNQSNMFSNPTALTGDRMIAKDRQLPDQLPDGVKVSDLNGNSILQNDRQNQVGQSQVTSADIKPVKDAIKQLDEKGETIKEMITKDRIKEPSATDLAPVTGQDVIDGIASEATNSLENITPGKPLEPFSPIMKSSHLNEIDSNIGLRTINTTP